VLDRVADISRPKKYVCLPGTASGLLRSATAIPFWQATYADRCCNWLGGQSASAEAPKKGIKSQRVRAEFRPKIMLAISRAIVYVHPYSTAINSGSDQRGRDASRIPFSLCAVRQLFDNQIHCCRLSAFGFRPLLSPDGASAARRLKNFGKRDLLLKMPVENFGHFSSRPREMRINEHKFGSLCSQRHAHERQNPVF
jgi:hypothetical protein